MLLPPSIQSTISHDLISVSYQIKCTSKMPPIASDVTLYIPITVCHVSVPDVGFDQASEEHQFLDSGSSVQPHLSEIDLAQNSSDTAMPMATGIQSFTSVVSSLPVTVESLSLEAKSAEDDPFGAIEILNGDTVEGQVFYLTRKLYYFDIPAIDPDMLSDSLVVAVLVTDGQQAALYGRYLEPPTLAVYDAAAVNESSSTWSLTITANSNPIICPGRWFFSVVGKSFMKRTKYTLSLVMKYKSKSYQASNFVVDRMVDDFVMMPVLGKSCTKKVLLEIDDTEFDSVISPTHSVASTTKNEESDISPLHSIGVSSPWEANNALDEHLPIKGDQERIQKETKKPSSQAQPGAANAADSAPPDTSSDSKCESQDNTDGDVPYIISSWTPSDVSAWLTENGYPSGIVDLFLREAIDGKRLCVLLKLCYQLNLFKATDQLGEDELVQMGEAATDIYRKETILLIAKLELSREMHRMLH